MKYYLWLCLVMLGMGIFCIQCSFVSPFPDRPIVTRDVPENTLDNESLFPKCVRGECCSESRECERICENTFNQFLPAIDRCRTLPQQLVFDIENLVRALENPIVQDLRRANVRTDFRRLLALDYVVLLDIVERYRIDNARELLLWFAEEDEVADELLRLRREDRNEIMYGLLASAGDRNVPGAAENGLARNISFDETFFSLLVRYFNNSMLQIVHDMIRGEMCAPQFGGGKKAELCILRIYCRERRGLDNEYVHSEDLRRFISLRLEDKQFFDYIRQEVYNSALDDFNLSQPLMNDMTCQIVCNDTFRGCEGWNLQ